jgi:hypothetical protein
MSNPATLPRRGAIVALLASVLFATCGAPSHSEPGRVEASAEGPEAAVALPTPPALPWTREFLEESVLVAREVLIEGPAGLVDHVAVRQELDTQDVSVRTVPEGLLQETVIKPGSGGLIWCQLDNLTINAEVRLRVLERVGEVPVRVEAVGDAYWKNARSGAERRGERLELIGKRPQ